MKNDKTIIVKFNYNHSPSFISKSPRFILNKETNKLVDRIYINRDDYNAKDGVQFLEEEYK